MSRSSGATLLALLTTCATLAPVSAQGPDEGWRPTSTYDGRFDWVQMNSGEWLKGEITVMYDENLEFDSDEFDELTLGWDDIAQIHSSQTMNVGLTGRREAVGRLFLVGDKVTVVGDETLEFSRSEVLTLTAGAPKEINFWTMKVFAGLIVRAGNSDVREANLQASLKRRTVRNRILLDAVGNQNVTDGEQVSNNLRASAAWDKFLSPRVYLMPIFGEYYRDPFQNIDYRTTAGLGAGYQIIDSPKVDWHVSGGPAWQHTRFASVAADESADEDTPALVLTTTAEWDISKWLEFDGQYRMQLVEERSGSYNHHLLASFETEITSVVDFDVAFIWDRVEDPRPDEDGLIPEQDDFRTTVGLTFEF